MFKPWLDKYPNGINNDLDESQFIDLVDMVEQTFKAHPEHTAFIRVSSLVNAYSLVC